MSRFFAFAAAIAGLSLGLAAVVTVGCGASNLEDMAESTSDSGTKFQVDGGAVDPPDSGGSSVDAGPSVTPSCEKYCTLIMKNCQGEFAQYASLEECQAFCRNIPETVSTRNDDDGKNHSLVCRQKLADTPALTEPQKYCLQAGPFGDNVCGDRCNVFCSLATSICSPSGSYPAFDSQPDCANHCATFTFREQGTDGGGQGPNGPDGGDTLNCRLFQLRRAVLDQTACSGLRPDAGPCR